MSLVKTPPQEMAKAFCQHPENLENLLYIENMQSFAYYAPSEGYYKTYTDDDFERIVYLFLINNYKQAISKSLVKDIVTQIGWITVNRIKDIISSDYVALSDCLLNMKTFEFEPFSIKKIVFHKIQCKSADIQWNQNSRFASFLDEIFQDNKGNVDREMISFVQEIFGYCLLPSLEAHASFFFVGSGNNGKSVIMSLLREMIGKQNTVAESIESLTAPGFTKSTLVGKKLNLSTEEESKYIKSDTFKALVSGDPISVEFKYGKRIMWEPTCKHVYSTNEFPTFSGFNEGLLRRIKIVPFRTAIPTEKRDTKLIEKLLAEIGIIIAWSIGGAKKLIANKFFFVEPDATKSSLSEFAKNLSSAVLYVEEQFEENALGQIFNDALYEQYKIWADRRGKKKQSYYSFFKDINKVLKLEPEFANRIDGNGDTRLEEYKKLIPRISTPQRTFTDIAF